MENDKWRKLLVKELRNVARFVAESARHELKLEALELLSLVRRRLTEVEKSLGQSASNSITGGQQMDEPPKGGKVSK